MHNPEELEAKILEVLSALESDWSSRTLSELQMHQELSELLRMLRSGWQPALL